MAVHLRGTAPPADESHRQTPPAVATSTRSSATRQSSITPGKRPTQHYVHPPCSARSAACSLSSPRSWHAATRSGKPANLNLKCIG
jgi:hypothetical protein